jgi:hypothetical protein
MIWFFPLPVQASDCAYPNQISNNKNFIFGYSFSCFRQAGRQTFWLKVQ